jgi:hypothetical protein
MTRLVHIPEFQRGGEISRFVSYGDLVIHLGLGLMGYHDFWDGDDLEGILHDDLLTIYSGFPSDGCSPAFRIPFTQRWIGTFTPYAALPACYAHDFLRKYLAPPCTGLTRKMTDNVFFNLLNAEGFGLRDIYHGAVAGPAGSIYIYLTRKRTSNAGCRIHS